MAQCVAGEQYESITGQLFEIGRQLRQRGGYPFDPEKLQKHLQKAIEGKFNAAPEAKRGEQLIKASDQEGKEIIYDLEQIRDNWVDFYNDHNLSELAGALPKDVLLTAKQIEFLKEKTKEGFNRLILLPPLSIQKKNLGSIKNEMDKKVAGLSKDAQYTKTYLDDTVEPNFPDHLKSIHRPDRPYLLLINDTAEVDPGTLGKSADKLRKLFSENQFNGLTLAEYLIFQRDYTLRHQDDKNPHPNTMYWTWLLDDEIDESSKDYSGRVLRAYWYPGDRRVYVSSFSAGAGSSGRGARPSAIFEL